MAGHATVLVIDDAEDVRIALTELLQYEGFAAVTARDGREALDLLLGGLRPCAILLDLMMPGMNGWDFRAEQMRVPEFARIPVAVLSASYNAQATLAQFGAVEFFSKPAPTSAIIAFVKRHCQAAPASD
jgi:CheY-like chemotaxis protein